MAKAKIKAVNRAALKNGLYSAQFGDAGAVEIGAPQFFADWGAFNEVQKGLIINGLSQKLNDSHAGAENAKQAYDWTAQTAQALLDGKWSTRVPGEGGVTGGSFAAAYAEFKAITIEAAREAIAAAVEDNLPEDGSLTEKAVYAQVRASVLKKYPQIQDILARMKAEAVAKKDTIETNL